MPVVPTCSYQSTNVSFPIGDVPDSTLANAGDTSSWANGNLISNGCTNTNSVQMTFNGTADSDNSNLFKIQGGASGVGIELQTNDGRSLDAIPNSTAPIVWSPQAAGSAYSYRARYVRTTAPLAIGPGNANITVNIVYF